MLNLYFLPVVGLGPSYTINLFGIITSELASHFISDLIELRNHRIAGNGDSRIKVIINSSGGDVDSGLAIVDAMLATHEELTTIGTGEVCSAALPILAAGDPKRRFITPNCIGMHHRGLTTPAGEYDANLVTEYENYTNIREQDYADIMGILTLKPSSWWLKTAKPDSPLWIPAEDMCRLGIVDSIISPYENQKRKGRKPHEICEA